MTQISQLRSCLPNVTKWYSKNLGKLLDNFTEGNKYLQTKAPFLRTVNFNYGVLPPIYLFSFQTLIAG
jgi:hypothetical protein